MNDFTRDDLTLLADCVRARLARLRQQRTDMDTKFQTGLLLQALGRLEAGGPRQVTELSARHWCAVYNAVLDASNRLSDGGVSYNHASTVVHVKQLDRLLELLGPEGAKMSTPASARQAEQESDLQAADYILRFLKG